MSKKEFTTLGMLRYYPETDQAGVAFDHAKMATYPVETQLAILDGAIDILETYERLVKKYDKEFFENPDEIIRKEVEELTE